jgi:hypothetical protein
MLDVKDGLREMNGRKPLPKKSFCEKNDIEVLDMNKEINVRGTSTCRIQKVTTCIYYHVENFLVAIDAILIVKLSVH